MEKEFLSYELALKMKELGFDEPCLAFYLNGHNKVIAIGTDQVFTSEDLPIVKAPLYQQAFRWFRKNYKHLKFVIQQSSLKDTYYDFYHFEVIKVNSENFRVHTEGVGGLQSMEEAEELCLRILCEFAKPKQK